MFKNMTKFAGVMIAIVLVGGLVLLAMQYFRYRSSPEYRAGENLKEIEKQYAEDSYGGDTPEETLALFISALKVGDTNLAAKYFVLDAQVQWREDLAVMKEKGFLVEMVKDLNKTSTKIDGDTAFFTLTNQDMPESQLVMHKNPLNNRWKITEL